MMNEDVEDEESNIYPGIIGIGCVISVWVTFFIYTIYPDIGKEFIFAMFITWLVIFFYWTWCDPPVHYQVDKLEREIIELKKEIRLDEENDENG